MLKKLKLDCSMMTYKTSRINTKKRCPFHPRWLECKSRKSRNTWSNRQIRTWRQTKWRWAKANRVLPRDCTGYSKYPLPTTQEKTLHMDITRWSTAKSDWLYSMQPKMEKLYAVNKRVWSAVLGCNLKNNRMTSVCFQGKPFNITVIQVYAPKTNVKEAEIEQFYGDLQDFLELTLKKMMSFSSQGTGMQK